MELWDLYYSDRSPAGRDHVRGTPIPPGLHHLAVHVWIKNSRGQYLISQRAADRPTYPLWWECVGGSALKGEDSRTAAVREVFEEVGIPLLPEQGRLIFSRVRERQQDILDVWLFSYEGEIRLDQATTREVADCRWMEPEEIRRLLSAGKLVPTLSYFFADIQGQEESTGVRPRF